MRSTGILASSSWGLITLTAALCAQGTSLDKTWPDYRGPRRDGHAPQAQIPLRWSEEKNVRWKTPIHGKGWSSPVVWGDRVWLSSATADGHQNHVIAIDLKTGKTIIDRQLFTVEHPDPINGLNSFASPSPTIEEGRVYIHFGTYGTACLDTDSGETLWERRDLNCDHKEGPGSSPVLYRDLLIFNVDGGDVQYVIALDKKTGNTRWKTHRTVDLSRQRSDLKKAFSTPIIIDVDGRSRLISSGAGATVGYEPDSGKELWMVRHKGFSMSARPLMENGLLFLNTGFMLPRLIAVKTDGEGDVTESNIIWSQRRNIPTIPSSLLIDGRLYMVDNSGVASCREARSGDLLWKERIGGEYCASPIYANGRIYFFDRDGRSVVIEAADEFRELAVNELDEGFMASPAVVGDTLILRSITHLYRIEKD